MISSNASSLHKGLFAALIAFTLVLIFPASHLRAQSGPIFGVLNTPGGAKWQDNDQNDTYYNQTYSADAWMAIAENSPGDGSASCQIGSKAAEYEGFAVDAYTQWMTADYGNGIRSVSIPVQ